MKFWTKFITVDIELVAELGANTAVVCAFLPFVYSEARKMNMCRIKNGKKVFDIPYTELYKPLDLTKDELMFCLDLLVNRNLLVYEKLYKGSTYVSAQYARIHIDCPIFKNKPDELFGILKSTYRGFENL